MNAEDDEAARLRARLAQIEARPSLFSARPPPAKRRRIETAPLVVLSAMILLVTFFGCVLLLPRFTAREGSKTPSTSPPGVAYVEATAKVPLIRPDGRLFQLAPTTVSCLSPGPLGLARAVYPRMAGSANLTKAFEQTSCLPPIATPPGVQTVYQLHHLEDVTWRASLDDGLTWIGGPLRVAELRSTWEGQQVIEFVAADDLEPIETPSPPPPVAPPAPTAAVTTAPPAAADRQQPDSAPP